MAKLEKNQLIFIGPIRARDRLCDASISINKPKKKIKHRRILSDRKPTRDREDLFKDQYWLIHIIGRKSVRV